jgi:hypothetical protein
VRYVLINGSLILERIRRGSKKAGESAAPAASAAEQSKKVL